MSIPGGNNNFDMNRKSEPLPTEDKIIWAIIGSIVVGTILIITAYCLS